MQAGLHFHTELVPCAEAFEQFRHAIERCVLSYSYHNITGGKVHHYFGIYGKILLLSSQETSIALVSIQSITGNCFGTLKSQTYQA